MSSVTSQHSSEATKFVSQNKNWQWSSFILWKWLQHFFPCPFEMFVYSRYANFFYKSSFSLFIKNLRKFLSNWTEYLSIQRTTWWRRWTSCGFQCNSLLELYCQIIITCPTSQWPGIQCRSIETVWLGVDEFVNIRLNLLLS